MRVLRVLLIDDNPFYLESAGRFLEAQRLVVVGKACSGFEGVKLAEEQRPDLAFVDLAMPGINGLESTRRLKALSIPPCVVIVSLYDAAEYAAEARAAGADAFISKHHFGEQALSVISTLFALEQVGK